MLPTATMSSTETMPRYRVCSHSEHVPLAAHGIPSAAVYRNGKLRHSISFYSCHFLLSTGTACLHFGWQQERSFFFDFLCFTNCRPSVCSMPYSHRVTACYTVRYLPPPSESSQWQWTLVTVGLPRARTGLSVLSSCAHVLRHAQSHQRMPSLTSVAGAARRFMQATGSSMGPSLSLAPSSSSGGRLGL